MENSSSFPVVVFGIFFGLMWLMCLFSVLQPQSVVNLTAKYFKWSIKLYGFEAEIKPTPRAIVMVRIWNSFMLLIVSVLLFLAFTGN